MIDQLVRAGAMFLDGHFVYLDGLHGCDCFFSDGLLPIRNRLLLENIAAEMVGPFELSGIEAVMADGGEFNQLLAHCCADWLGAMHNGSPARGQSVLIVNNDVIRGGKLTRLRHTAEDRGARVVGAAVICNLGDATADRLGVPKLVSVVHHSLKMFWPDECELCKSEPPIPIAVDVGAGGKDFAQEYPQYPGGFIELLAG